MDSEKQWQPIESAPKERSVEFIGVRKQEHGWSDPFVSFWSPTLNKFYCSPSHWIAWPADPPQEPAHAE